MIIVARVFNNQTTMCALIILWLLRGNNELSFLECSINGHCPMCYGHCPMCYRRSPIAMYRNNDVLNALTGKL